MKSPYSGLDAAMLMSISTWSPVSNVLFEGAPVNAILTSRCPESDNTGVAVNPFKGAGPSLNITVAL